MQKSKVNRKIGWQSQTIKNSVKTGSSLILYSHMHMADQAAGSYMIKLFYSQNPSLFLGQDVILGVSQGCALKEGVCCCRSWDICCKRDQQLQEKQKDSLMFKGTDPCPGHLDDSGPRFWWCKTSDFCLNSQRQLQRAQSSHFPSAYLLDTWCWNLSIFTDIIEVNRKDLL